MDQHAVTWVMGSNDDPGLEGLRDALTMLYRVSPDLIGTLTPPAEFQPTTWAGETWLEGSQTATCALGRVTVTIRMAESGRFAWRLAVEVSLSLQ